MTALNDAQQANLNFLIAQSVVVNTKAYSIQYPDLDFGKLVTVDTSSPEWADGVVSFIDGPAGNNAEWGTGYAKDVPYADATIDRNDVPFYMAHIGYEFNDEELGKAQFLGIPLDQRKANAARRKYQEFMWRVTLNGDTTKSLQGLSNQTGVTSTVAPADGTGGVTTWFAADGTMTKTAAQIMRDFNGMLRGIWTASLTVEMADTVLFPIDTMSRLAEVTVNQNTTQTLLSYMMENNIYTLTTGQRLKVQGVLGLDVAGPGNTKEIVFYANREDVCRLHLPMPHRFKQPIANGPYNYMVPGMFRTGGVEVMRPGAFRYLTGI